MLAKLGIKPVSKKSGCLSIVALLFLCSLPGAFMQETDSAAPSATSTPVELPATAPAAVVVNALVEAPVELPTPIPTAVPTAAPVVQPVILPTEPPAGATVNNGANLRSGPGTDYAVVNTAAAGTPLTLIGRNQVGDWYQTDSGVWISAGLVSNAPIALAVVAAPPLPTPTTAVVVAAPPPPVVVAAPTAVPVVNAPASGASNPDAFVCNGGCTQPPPGATCVIKGNVNSNKELIYHTTSSRSYKNTDIKPEEGDRWFCTEAEAQAAGFRAPEN